MTTTLGISTEQIAARAREALARCGASLPEGSGSMLQARSPITGEAIASLTAHDEQQVEEAIARAKAAFATWRTTPAPARGAVVRRLGQLLTEHKQDLADLITIEAGKIRSEALGEVQEMIDICDLALGLSRQIGGSTLPSERPEHRLMENWHPLGVVGVISAFNFPAAVWAWNAAIALVCGNTVVWKPSELTTLTSLACNALLARAAADCNAPSDLGLVVLSDAAGAGVLVDSPDVPLVSATGSERMGAAVAPRVAARFGRSLLELGGNNAMVVTASADLDLAVRAIVFSAVGTAGQRCTTLRRVIAHESIADELTSRLTSAYSSLRIGNPFSEGVLVGPLISSDAAARMRQAIEQAEEEGGKVVTGGALRSHEDAPHAAYVEPTIVRMPAQTDIVRTETFAPVLYLMTYSDLEQAIAVNNDVPQGLSSSIFTADVREAERFLAADGSDCGIANVNIGTSGAEIGAAFGGEKSTGGGRESGSDAWKAYMRRSTNTINYSDELPLAQGVEFV
jgi:aldehyde dehydrogenase (NAD+)